jgi:uncharacterized protein YkwD
MGAVPAGPYCESVATWEEPWEVAELELLEFLNFARETGGRCQPGEPRTAPPLVMRPELRCAARLHSRDMNDRQFFAHVNQDGVGPEDRIRQTGYSFGFASESIAEERDMSGPMEGGPMEGPPRYEPLQELFEAGGSDCDNLLDPRFDAVGIGFFEGDFGAFWTLDFAGP